MKGAIPVRGKGGDKVVLVRGPKVLRRRRRPAHHVHAEQGCRNR